MKKNSSVAEKLTGNEWQAVSQISIILSLRMIALFIMLPVFSLYAATLPGATPVLVGIAIGIYGLFQAVFQVPFGILSDRLGRKQIIALGLCLFILGSLVAGSAHSITSMIIGRSLQGTGAVGATLLALMSDLTRESQRTKAMAIAGISIGFSFSLALLAGPILSLWWNVGDLFFLSAFLSCIALLLLGKVANPASITEAQRPSLLSLLKQPELLPLNLGIFILHTIFTASFVVLPIAIKNNLFLPANSQWIIYLPALLFACMMCLLLIKRAEQKMRQHFYFLSSIASLIVAELILWQSANSMPATITGLCCFFTGFTLLEAFLPSMVSKVAPKNRKGSALGLYSFAQFSGIFAGGVTGGWLYGYASFTAVYLFCVLLASLWLIVAYIWNPSTHLESAAQKACA